MECAKCEMRGAAPTECMSERISEQVSHESCPGMRSETHSIVVAPRVSRFTHSTRRPPHGGRRMER
eukprot:2273107-Lingulodinium_polyedra.AAC.1